MSPKKIKDEINKTQEAIQKITGKAPAFFRPPFGVTNPLLARALNSSDLKIIGWSIRSMDTTYRSQDRIINNILDRIHPGDIILLHDTSKHIINVLEKVLVYCRKENYKPVTISELIKHQV
jgi:peptidoglycan/xylan/chitin deacetylase (PgdA/CDA1 family)